MYSDSITAARAAEASPCLEMLLRFLLDEADLLAASYVRTALNKWAMTGGPLEEALGVRTHANGRSVRTLIAQMRRDVAVVNAMRLLQRQGITGWPARQELAQTFASFSVSPWPTWRVKDGPPENAGQLMRLCDAVFRADPYRTPPITADGLHRLLERVALTRTSCRKWIE